MAVFLTVENLLYNHEDLNSFPLSTYKDALKGGPVLLSNSQARLGRISRNLALTF